MFANDCGAFGMTNDPSLRNGCEMLREGVGRPANWLILPSVYPSTPPPIMQGDLAQEYSERLRVPEQHTPLPPRAITFSLVLKVRGDCDWPGRQGLDVGTLWRKVRPSRPKERWKNGSQSNKVYFKTLVTEEGRRLFTSFLHC